MSEQMRQKLGFEITDDAIRCIKWDDGGQNPASNAEIALWDALAALSQPAAAWQPIETAPKDGKAVLVFPPTWDDDRDCSIAQYESDQYSKRPRPYWSRDDDLGKATCSRERPPTHWQLLPSAPKTAP